MVVTSAILSQEYTEELRSGCELAYLLLKP